MFLNHVILITVLVSFRTVKCGKSPPYRPPQFGQRLFQSQGSGEDFSHDQSSDSSRLDSTHMSLKGGSRGSPQDQGFGSDWSDGWSDGGGRGGGGPQPPPPFGPNPNRPGPGPPRTPRETCWSQCERYRNAIFTAFDNTTTKAVFDEYKTFLQSLIPDCINNVESDQGYIFTYLDPNTGQLIQNGTAIYDYCKTEPTCDNLITSLDYDVIVGQMALRKIMMYNRGPLVVLFELDRRLEDYPPSDNVGSVVILFSTADLMGKYSDKDLMYMTEEFTLKTDRYAKIVIIDPDRRQAKSTGRVFRGRLQDLSQSKFKSDLLPCFSMSSMRGYPNNPPNPRPKAQMDAVSWPTVWIIIGVAVGVIVLLCVSCTIGVCWYKKRNDRRMKRKVSDLRHGRRRHSSAGKDSDRQNRYSHFEGRDGFPPRVARETDKWEISLDRLDITDVRLGSGAFSIVYKGQISGQAPVVAIHKQSIQSRALTDCIVAVKMLPEYADVHGKIDFMQEINFMKDLGYHNHLVNLVACVTVSEPTCLITEFCDRGDLLQLVRKEKTSILTGYENEDTFLRFRDLLAFAWQIADGMDYLSSKGCIHRDLAARNILIDNNKNAKVGDFGLCRLLDRTLYTTRGGRLPIKWMALESLLHYEYSTKSDVWSFGVLLYELFTLGLAPFAWLQPSDMIDHLSMGRRLDRPEHANDAIEETCVRFALMTSCWLESTDLRPTFEKLRQQLATMLEDASGDYGYVEHTNTSYVQTGIDNVGAELFDNDEDLSLRL